MDLRSIYSSTFAVFRETNTFSSNSCRKTKSSTFIYSTLSIESKEKQQQQEKNKPASLHTLSDRSVSESTFDLCNLVFNSPHLREPIGACFP